jgi:hypothetical protein
MSQPAPTPPPATPATPAPSRGRRLLRWALPVLALAVAAGVWQRERLWAWYCAERLERADDPARAEWGQKLAAAGDPAVPTLLGLLRHDEPGVCAAAKDALGTMAGTWPAEDPRRAELATRFFEAEPRFSTPGRATALDLLPALLTPRTPGAVEKAHGMIATAAKSESVDVRIQAIATALRPEVDAVPTIVPLLADPVADVRRAAIVAVGSVREGRAAVADDELLKCLHDTDAEVRHLCEMSLRGRGRSPRDIRLGKRYTAPDPAERQKLLLDLAEEDELDVSVWLDRLTADADPAVRAGVARLAYTRNVDLGSRLDQLSQTDPDPTVRRVAKYYKLKIAARP